MLVYKVETNQLLTNTFGFWKGGMLTNSAMRHIRWELERKNIEPTPLNCFLAGKISKRAGKVWNSEASLRSALRGLPKEILDILVVRSYELIAQQEFKANEMVTKTEQKTG